MAAYETRVGVHTMKFTKPNMALLSIDVFGDEVCRLVACGEVVAAVAAVVVVMFSCSSSKGGSVSRADGEMGGELVEGRMNVFCVTSGDS